MKTYRWKFLREGMKSNAGNCTWEKGKWKTYEGDLVLCGQGFHCSKNVWQAFLYVKGEILARVEVSGKHKTDENKEVWEKMKIVKAYKWQKKDSVELAIYTAELVIDLYEKEYPNDVLPRKAIEATKKCLENPAEENAKAAYWAGEEAETVEAAYWAAKAAYWKAYWTAETAEAAYWAAEASYRAGMAAVIKKITKWIDKRVKSLEKIK